MRITTFCPNILIYLCKKKEVDLIDLSPLDLKTLQIPVGILHCHDVTNMSETRQNRHLFGLASIRARAESREWAGVREQRSLANLLLVLDSQSKQIASLQNTPHRLNFEDAYSYHGASKLCFHELQHLN